MGWLKRPSLRKITYGFAIAVIATPVVGMVAVNLALATPWACDWAAHRFERRLNLDTRIDRLSVWPWSGVTIHGLVVSPPPEMAATVKEPIFETSSIRIMPAWRKILSKQLVMNEVFIEQPRIVLPVELLASLIPKTTPPPPSALVAKVEDATATPDSKAPATPPTTPAAPPQTGTGPSAPPAPAAKPVTPPVLPPTSWCHIRNGSITINSARSSKRAEAHGIRGSIPLNGKAATSAIHIETLKAAGWQSEAPVDIPLKWTQPHILIGPLAPVIAGLNTTVSGRVSLVRGLPAVIVATCPKQAWSNIPLPMQAQASVGDVEARAEWVGLLSAPGTWRGQLQAAVNGVDCRQRNISARFDYGSCFATLQGGRLTVHDARLTSDDASVLGNATLKMDGNYAAALRLVTAPPTAQGMVHQLFPDIEQPVPLTPLSTPQRSALDLEVQGNFQHLSLRVGLDGPVIEIHPQAPKP